MDHSDVTVIKQHLIDPEICIRCNTCESVCPVNAITHDANNYVVDADICNGCMACISPCPTGSIDNWRTVPKPRAYSLDEQLGWGELPPELSAEELAQAGVADVEAALAPAEAPTPAAGASDDSAPLVSAQFGATLPPWSAAHA
ncbi:MAG TPA: 4Fe-4S binding protein, partial [Burkholderiaceae bacterium]|nr:4Fe-4S binding protein [Burkholderiaceae bacterium]